MIVMDCKVSVPVALTAKTRRASSPLICSPGTAEPSIVMLSLLMTRPVGPNAIMASFVVRVMVWLASVG